MMPIKKNAGRSIKKSSLTANKAIAAAKVAKEIFAKKRELPKAWKKGGREWNRVLGYFGTSRRRSRTKQRLKQRELVVSGHNRPLTLTGSCLCGGVKYVIDGELGAVTNCHCSLCRKMSGSAFASGATIPTALFRFVAGVELLKEWESSPGYRRVFCGRCGTPLLKKKDKDPDNLRFRPGSLDSDPGVKASKHTHVSSKAPWFEINDGLPQAG